MLHYVILSLGTNIGLKTKNLDDSINLLEKKVGQIIKKTDYLATIPWGYNSYNIFINQSVKIATKLSPIKLLNEIQKIEIELGRNRSEKDIIYKDRVIDIDIVYYDNIIFKNERLSIPHKFHVESREFSKKLNKELV